MFFLTTSSLRLLPVLVTGAMLFGCGQEPAEEVSEPKVRPIKLITIEQASDERTASYPGVIDAAQTAELSFQVSGLVLELPVTESQDVKQGDVIARLDTRNFENEVAKAQAQYTKANEDYQRGIILKDKGAISQSAFEEYESAVTVARAALDNARKALSDTTLVAPFDGAIASLGMEKQQNVQAGATVATVIDITGLEATVNIPANIVAGIESRSEPLIRVILDAAPDEPIAAAFKNAELLADTASQTYEVTFSFTPPEKLLVLPGMNATVEVSSSELGSENAGSRVAVPLAAILYDGENQYVWVVDGESMKVSRQAITIEPGIGDTMIVTEGLQSGDVIAGAGANYLAEGMQVRAWER